MNGASIRDVKCLLATLRQLSTRPPFFAELWAENCFKLLIGLGRPFSCAQYSHQNGTPPYLMAMRDEPQSSDQPADFLIGNEQSPVPARYCLPLSQVEEIAVHFFETGVQSPTVDWEQI
jgi:hypothetical protein